MKNFNPPQLKYNLPHINWLKLNLVERRKNNFKLIYGNFGLQIQESCWMTIAQIEIIRQLLKNTIKKPKYIRRKLRMKKKTSKLLEKLWIRIYPCQVITKKPPQSRMGGGKGQKGKWIIPIRAGRVIFEMKYSFTRKTVRRLPNLLYILSKIVRRIGFQSKIITKKKNFNNFKFNHKILL